MKKLLISIGICCALAIGSSYAGVTADGTTAYKWDAIDFIVVFSNDPADDPSSIDGPLGAGAYLGSGCRSYLSNDEVMGLICIGTSGSTVSTFSCDTTSVQVDGPWCLFAENPRIGDKAWAIKFVGGEIPTNDGRSIVRCEGTDTFDPATGCSPSLPTQVGVESGYIQLDHTVSGPSSLDCSLSSHSGRMIVEDVSNFLYICTQSGWTRTSLNPLP